MAEKSIEESLWASANKLRGSVESAECKQGVLGLIFLKFASDKNENKTSVEFKEFLLSKNAMAKTEAPETAAELAH